MKKRVNKRPLTEVVAQCAQPLLVEGSKTEDLGITNKPATNTDPLLAKRRKPYVEIDPWSWDVALWDDPCDAE